MALKVQWERQQIYISYVHDNGDGGLLIFVKHQITKSVHFQDKNIKGL